jgi:hypothetical protein
MLHEILWRTLFFVLTFTNMVKVWNFEVVSDNTDVMGMRTNQNHAHSWITSYKIDIYISWQPQVID